MSTPKSCQTTFLVCMSFATGLVTSTGVHKYVDTEKENVQVEKIVSVYDGDTFRVDLKNAPKLCVKNMPIRINGVDTPEMKEGTQEAKEKAKEAKKFLFKTLKNAEKVELKNLKRGSFFRFIADVFVDGESVGLMLIDEGHARPYDGGKREPW